MAKKTKVKGGTARGPARTGTGDAEHWAHPMPPLLPRLPCREELERQIELLPAQGIGFMCGMMLDMYWQQRDMDRNWALVVEAVGAVGLGEAPRPAVWWQDLFARCGYDLRLAGEATWQQLKDRWGEGFIVLQLRHGFTPEREPARRCDVCNEPASRFCLCGEVYCSPACRTRDWPAHRRICEQVIDNNELVYTLIRAWATTQDQDGPDYSCRGGSARARERTPCARTSLKDHVESFGLVGLLVALPLYFDALDATSRGGSRGRRTPAEAVAQLRQFADSGEVHAQYLYGKLLDDGKAGHRAEAEEYWSRAAASGCAWAWCGLGLLRSRANDWGAATSHWREALAICQVPEAAFNLGMVFDFGYGVESDKALSMDFYALAKNAPLADLAPVRLPSKAGTILGAQDLDGRIFSQIVYSLGPGNKHQSVFASRAASNLGNYEKRGIVPTGTVEWRVPTRAQTPGERDVQRKFADLLRQLGPGREPGEEGKVLYKGVATADLETPQAQLWKRGEEALARDPRAEGGLTDCAEAALSCKLAIDPRTVAHVRRAAQEALRADPANVAAATTEALLLASFDGDARTAVKMLDRVLSGSPTWRHFKMRAIFHACCSDFTLAVEDLSAAMELEPDSAVGDALLLLRGRAYHGVNNNKKAKRDFTRLADSTTCCKDRAEALYSLSMLAFGENDDKAGLSYYSQAKKAEADANLSEPIVGSAKATCALHAAQRTPHQGGERECHHCGALSSNLKRCSGCKRAAYCSDACQSAAWRQHKRECGHAKEQDPSQPQNSGDAGDASPAALGAPLAPQQEADLVQAGAACGEEKEELEQSLAAVTPRTPVPPAAGTPPMTPEKLPASHSQAAPVPSYPGGGEDTFPPTGCCHHCKVIVDGLKKCARCRRVAYCSEECQRAAWKHHKHECKRGCQQAASSAPQSAAPGAGLAGELAAKQASVTRPGKAPEDLGLDLKDHGVSAEAVWEDGLKLLACGKHAAACREFCYAIFLNNSLDLRLAEAETAWRGASDRYAELLELRARRSFPGVNAMLQAFQDLAYAAEVDNEREVAGFALIFAGRQLGVLGDVRHMGLIPDGQEPFRVQMRLVEAAAVHLPPDQHLNMMHELAFTYRDNFLVEQSLYWYKKFVKHAPKDHHLLPKALQSALMVHSLGAGKSKADLARVKARSQWEAQEMIGTDRGRALEALARASGVDMRRQ